MNQTWKVKMKPIPNFKNQMSTLVYTEQLPPWQCLCFQVVPQHTENKVVLRSDRLVPIPKGLEYIFKILYKI